MTDIPEIGAGFLKPIFGSNFSTVWSTFWLQYRKKTLIWFDLIFFLVLLVAAVTWDFVLPLFLFSLTAVCCVWICSSFVVFENLINLICLHLLGFKKIVFHDRVGFIGFRCFLGVKRRFFEKGPSWWASGFSWISEWVLLGTDDVK